MSHDSVRPRPSRGAVMRAVVFLTAGALTVAALSGCSGDDPTGKPLAEQDIAPAARSLVADGGTLRWAVDTVPETLNAYQSDADATTLRVAQAVLPSMYRLDSRGRPQLNSDYVEKAEVVETEPKQVVLYKLNQQAVWSDGREIGAADFAAQWRALSGKDSAYWTARNAGYERIEKIERGANDLEVRVTFARPYADWKSLFTPLYPKQVMGTPDAFNDRARRKLAVTGGPFRLKKVDRKADEVILERNPRWWGRPAKLDEIVLRAVPRDERTAALADGELDLAEIDPETMRRIAVAARSRPSAAASGTPLMGADGSTSASASPDAKEGKGEKGEAKEDSSDDKPARRADADDESGEDADEDGRKDGKDSRAGSRQGGQEAARELRALRGFEVRRSLEAAYTQLAMNGSRGPLADERVRRAVARALDRKALAAAVLRPLGLPAEPVGSHLALAGQPGYADNSDALGGRDTEKAEALLADAGWVRGGPVKEKGQEKKQAAGATSDRGRDADSDDDGTYIVGQDDKARAEDERRGEGAENGRKAEDAEETKRGKGTAASEDGEDGKDRKDAAEDDGGDAARHLAQDGRTLVQGGAPGAYAPKGTAAPAGGAAGVFAKDGKALSLEFVVPAGEGSQPLRTVADRIAAMLDEVGIRTRIVKVDDASYFKDHIASGQFDLALYSWPASAFPATDARPIYAKPVPAADGSLNVEQNWTRVGTDQVDQLFEQAAVTLDDGERERLIREADSRIWAAAGSIPLYQRPELTAARKNLVNAGAFGFRTPVYEDMGFLRKGAKPSVSPSEK